jgi:tripartite-type tricarboxylate transporter receptor subunit TctC
MAQRARSHRWFAVLGVLISVSSSVAWGAEASGAAQAYPARPIRIIVPTSPSGGTDFIARLYGERISEALGQPVIIDNRPGATGIIGLELAATAPPDGHTLIVLNIGHILAGVLAKKPALDVASYAPVAILASYPVVLVVHPSLPAKSVSEFVALAKSRPGKLNYASGGVAGLQHMAAELFRREAGIDITHVPYKGTAPGLLDLVSGAVQLTLCSIPPALPLVKSGKLRALAVTGKKRAGALRGTPTFIEVGLSGVVFEPWFGVLAPAKTPEAGLKQLHGTITRAGETPEINARVAAAGLDPVVMSRSEFETYYHAERVKWVRIAHDAGIQ